MEALNETMEISCTVENNTLSIASNFDVMANRVTSLVSKYTDASALDNAAKSELQVVKKSLVHLRTTLTKEFTAWKKGAITNPLAVIQAEFDRLLTVVTDGERAVDERIAVYEQQRIDTLTKIYEGYRMQVIEKYGLTGQFADKIVLQKSYFNKTAKEDDVLDDIIWQAKESVVEQQTYNQSVELLKAELKDTPLNVNTYIELLSCGRSIADVLSLAKRDKAIATEKQTETEKQTDKTVLDKTEMETTRKFENTVDEKEVSVDNNEVRTRTIRLTYSKDKASLIKDLVISLQKAGVNVEMLKA